MANKSVGLSGDFEILIGSGKGCGIRLTMNLIQLAMIKKMLIIGIAYFVGQQLLSSNPN
ncbi:hypothetical protein THIOM_005466, partial [Candidatus Thiomargarita nelsonii]